MTVDRERRRSDTTWFARQLGDGWTSAGDGIYYPPDPTEAEHPAASRRRQELIRLRERLIERVARFPNAVAERQLRAIEHELGELVGSLGPAPLARA